MTKHSKKAKQATKQKNLQRTRTLDQRADTAHPQRLLPGHNVQLRALAPRSLTSNACNPGWRQSFFLLVHKSAKGYSFVKLTRFYKTGSLDFQILNPLVPGRIIKKIFNPWIWNVDKGLDAKDLDLTNHFGLYSCPHTFKLFCSGIWVDGPHSIKMMAQMYQLQFSYLHLKRLHWHYLCPNPYFARKNCCWDGGNI